MKHKLGIAVLAALMALAGTREAYQQLDGLKASVGEWTRTSILGNLLVSAASGESADAPSAQQQPTVLLAHAQFDCPFESARAAAQSSQARRADATARAANADHARAAVKRQPETNFGEFALNLDAAQHGSTQVDEKAAGQLVVSVVPRIEEIAKTLEASEEIKAETIGRRELTEADRARAAAEWKKLGLRKVFVRVAREGAARAQKGGAAPVPAAFDPHAFASAFTFRSITGLDEATDVPPAPRGGDSSHDAPSDDTLSEATAPDFGFDADRPGARPSFDCDREPLG